VIFNLTRKKPPVKIGNVAKKHTNPKEVFYMGDCNNLNCDCQDSKKQGIIYLITNLINGKKYVGQTRQKLNERIHEHKRKSNKIIKGIDGAIKKYGWENFKVEIIEECPIEMLNEREIFWISELNTKIPNGYNITDGGDGSNGHSPSPETRAKISAANKGRPAPNKGKPCSEATRKKISEANKGKPAPNKGKPSPNKGKPSHRKGKTLPKETCAKMSAARMGSKNPNYGKHRKHTEETRARISASVKANWAKKKAEKALETKNE
jgi:group I intron endonuclease